MSVDRTVNSLGTSNRQVSQLMHDTIATWGKHTFTVCPPDTGFCDFPGVYIFAGTNEKRGRFAVYVAWAASLQDCLFEQRLWDRAARRGATHVHAMSVTTESDGRLITDALIREYGPSLNAMNEASAIFRELLDCDHRSSPANNCPLPTCDSSLVIRSSNSCSSSRS
jgi:hypothetical protein